MFIYFSYLVSFGGPASEACAWAGETAVCMGTKFLGFLFSKMTDTLRVRGSGGNLIFSLRNRVVADPCRGRKFFVWVWGNLIFSSRNERSNRVVADPCRGRKFFRVGRGEIWFLVAEMREVIVLWLITAEESLPSTTNVDKIYSRIHKSGNVAIHVCQPIF